MSLEEKKSDAKGIAKSYRLRKLNNGLLKISQVAHYAPDQVVSNDDLLRSWMLSDECIRSRTGILSASSISKMRRYDLATNCTKIIK